MPIAGTIPASVSIFFMAAVLLPFLLFLLSFFELLHLVLPLPYEISQRIVSGWKYLTIDILEDFFSDLPFSADKGKLFYTV